MRDVLALPRQHSREFSGDISAVPFPSAAHVWKINRRGGSRCGCLCVGVVMDSGAVVYSSQSKVPRREKVRTRDGVAN